MVLPLGCRRRGLQPRRCALAEAGRRERGHRLEGPIGRDRELLTDIESVILVGSPWSMGRMRGLQDIVPEEV